MYQQHPVFHVGHPSEYPTLFNFDNRARAGAILHAMATAPITAVHNGIGGTQLKLLMTLEGGQRVVFKPKWYERDYILEGPPYAGRDRHNGEVAAFHMSRILGFRRTPLAVGRTFSLTRDMIPVASDMLVDTFYEEDGATCFSGVCRHCSKSKENTYCTESDTIEGAIIMWLPEDVHLKVGRNPWRRTYKEKLLAKWEKDEAYCSIVRQIEPFNSSSHLLLDLIDTTVFDYLIGNADRHHYEVIDGVPDGMLVMLDNGKSFGNPYEDERSILAPLYQCCSLRFTTWQKLLSLRHSVLSSVLREVLRADPLDPVLTYQHYQALDRRLHKILQEVDQCIKTQGMRSVIIGAQEWTSESSRDNSSSSSSSSSNDSRNSSSGSSSSSNDSSNSYSRNSSSSSVSNRSSSSITNSSSNIDHRGIGNSEGFGSEGSRNGGGSSSKVLGQARDDSEGSSQAYGVSGDNAGRFGNGINGNDYNGSSSRGGTTNSGDIDSTTNSGSRDTQLSSSSSGRSISRSSRFTGRR